MKGTAFEDIHSELNTVYENLKAETLIAEIQENSNFGNDDFIIANQGTFSRAYRRDIINIDDVRHENMLTLNLSRNGLYDILPEGMFHEHHASNEGDSYSSRRKLVKVEEQNARILFAPLESEFFYQRCKVEQNERALLDEFYKLKTDFLINFWNLDTRIPRQFMLKLIKLLPHCHEIAGDLELTRLCLEKILNERVSFKKKYVDKTGLELDSVALNFKDGFQLGVDSVLDGNNYSVLSPILEVTIGPVPQKSVNAYLEKNGVSKFIEAFYDYFLPVEMEADTKIKVKKEVGFLLDNTLEPIMGISTYL